MIFNLHRPPTGFNFGIDDNPSKIPPNFGIPLFVWIALLPGSSGTLFDIDRVDGATDESATLPVSIGPLLSTVVVFFSLAPC